MISYQTNTTNKLGGRKNYGETDVRLLKNSPPQHCSKLMTQTQKSLSSPLAIAPWLVQPAYRSKLAAKRQWFMPRKQHKHKTHMCIGKDPLADGKRYIYISISIYYYVYINLCVYTHIKACLYYKPGTLKQPAVNGWKRWNTHFPFVKVWFIIPLMANHEPSKCLFRATSQDTTRIIIMAGQPTPSSNIPPPPLRNSRPKDQGLLTTGFP